MKPTHRMLLSAGIVGTILTGGVAIMAAASEGRLRQAPTETSVTRPDPDRAGPSEIEIPDGPTALPGFDPDVVIKDLSDDPGEVSGYWTPDRMADAEPRPVPELSIRIVDPRDQGGPD